MEIGDFFCSSKFEYKHIPIELLVYRVKHLSGDFNLNDHDEIKWVTRGELSQYDFMDADKPVVNKLMVAKGGICHEH